MDNWEYWWNMYVDTEFHSQFSKACSGRFRGKFKIKILGVPYHMIESKILIFDQMTYSNCKLEIEHKISHKFVHSKNDADWLVDFVFNNCEQYKFEDYAQGKIYYPYNIHFEWSLENKQTLSFEGQTACQAMDDAPMARLE